jgi:3-oxoacyl-(acyl-carrier-protein) synthase
VALCGGTDAQLEELLFANYCGSEFLASDDGRRPGFTAGEGSGILVLETVERARARGATVHAEILGYAVGAGDGRSLRDAEASPEAERLARVITAAIDDAGAEPDVVCLHGDGSAAHERAETAALARVFGARTGALPVLRMKDAHGDLGAASCPVELLACSAALQHAMLPPVVSSASTTPEVPPRRALVLSLGLFGESAALMLGKAGVTDAG